MTFTNLRRCLVVTTLIGLVGLSLNAQGQRLYDKKRDEQAQQAKEQAAALKSDPVFDTQLKNLTTLEALDVQTVMSGSKRDTRSIINSFVNWGHVFTFLEIVKTELALSDEQGAADGRTIATATADL